VKCRCGCGREAPRAATDRPDRGYAKGDELSYYRGHGRRKKTDRERLEERLQLNPATGCIEFTGHLTKSGGYGQLGVGSRDDGTRRLVPAHRLAWELAGRDYPPGKPFLLHSCDNPACCNIDHLRPGTDAENREDMARRARGRKGKMPFGVARNHARWMANISLRGKRYYLGTFDTVAEAAAIASEAKEMYYASQV
jgi:hypothetical protein